MQKADQGDTGELEGEGLRVALVRARFNDAITQASAKACQEELLRLGLQKDDIHYLSVPGALELAVALRALADSGDYDAMVAIGCVIRGDTCHFELVAHESAAGITRVALDHGVPIANAVLTCDDEAQAWARAVAKGQEAARVAVEMANLLEDLA